MLQVCRYSTKKITEPEVFLGEALANSQPHAHVVQCHVEDTDSQTIMKVASTLHIRIRIHARDTIIGNTYMYNSMNMYLLFVKRIQKMLHTYTE